VQALWQQQEDDADQAEDDDAVVDGVGEHTEGPAGRHQRHCHPPEVRDSA